MAWTVPPSADGERLVDHLHRHLVVVARRTVGPLIARGAVTLDGVIADIATPVRTGSSIDVDGAAVADLVARHRAVVPVDAPLTVVHRDEAVIAVDVPAGLHLAPTGGHGEDAVITRLLWHLGARPDQPFGPFRPHPVHRLDRAASGLLLFATSAGVATALQAALRAGEVHRTYRASVERVPEEDEGVVDAPIGRDLADDYRRAVRPVHAVGQDGVQTARTHWRVLDRFRGSGTAAGTTGVEVTLDTGRTHQVRAHLAHLGHPIVGDTLYGAAATPDEDGIALRAVRLELKHPVSGTRLGLAVPVNR